MSNDYGCKEYNDLSRRQFIGTASTAALTLGVFGSMLPRVAMAQSDDSNRDIIISVFLRGGCDGLSVCVPFGDAAYYSHRSGQAVAPPDSSAGNRAINLDGYFGVSPAMNALIESYAAGHLLFVHATGLSDSSRSHFDKQQWTEVGIPRDVTVGSGWLGRHLQTMPPLRAGNTLRGVSTSNAIPVTLAGGPGTAAIENVSDYNIPGSSKAARARRLDAIGAAYSREKPGVIQSMGLGTIDTIKLLEKIDFGSYNPLGGAVYPNNSIGYAFKSAAALIRSDVGVEAMTIDYGGWDTHADQGINGGHMYNLLLGMANAMGAFYRDMSGANRIGRTIVTVVSEFGRTVRENGSGGTDHGYGNAMLVMGGGVNGGRVMANWPGLAANQLFENQDLKITIDYRDILAEIVAKRLRNAGNVPNIFPGYTPTFRNAVA